MDNEYCVFCQIIAGSMPGKIIHEEDDLLAMMDINPQAPDHILIIPRKHIDRLSHVAPEDQDLLGRMLQLAAKLAKEHNYTDSGYRIVLNEGKDGGQTIYHIHMHLLAGRRFSWPPG